MIEIKNRWTGRYFRLHPQDWHVNSDTLYTVAKLIDLRLQRGP